MDKYIVLRDLTPRRRTTGLELPGAGPAASGFEPIPDMHIEAETATAAEAHDIARDPRVMEVARAMPTKLIAPVGGAAQASENAWGIAAVGADTATTTGAGVTVCVLDTGIDSDHPAFAGVEIVEEDFSGSGNGDRQGHGTHCAGTVFGRDVEGKRIGVARGVTKALIGKVLGDDGSGGSDMIFQGILWAMRNEARVVSMSLGFDFPGLVDRLVNQNGWPADLATSAALEAYRANLRMFDAIMGQVRAQAAFNGGAVLVAASGNESKRDENADYEISVSIPAAAEGIVSVGAVGQSNEGFRIADFSNTGPIISGPGVGVTSAKAGGGLVDFNGTSMATPHVAGCAALWWEELAALGIPAIAANVVARLRASAATGGFAPGTDIDDRGVGLVQAPPPRVG